MSSEEPFAFLSWLKMNRCRAFAADFADSSGLLLKPFFLPFFLFGVREGLLSAIDCCEHTSAVVAQALSAR